ncbi:hypothetical protein CALVIDRAFT_271047 [Calocera viscosa TUFC12733]|uniref:Uncharacterized protein n=1 Tax=Calocera viscosa (strain TUFC12733) TaxID=1330018 RepID=A0A167QXB3_CALVF|nr:hypothetical protein CALVIDRAFT_271047 [Calocera viscosa TUFC12733]
MASYISSWFSGSPAPKSPTTASAIPQITIANGDASDADATPRPSPQAEANHVNGVEVAHADAGDTMFPAPDSVQRAAAPTITLSSPTSSPVLDGSDRNMPPPPVPASSGVGGLKATVKAQKKALKRQLKEALAPGHSQMDWAILKTKAHNMRVSALKRHGDTVLTRGYRAWTRSSA